VKSWHYPIPSSEVWELCDPNPASDFHRPFSTDDGFTGLSNGYFAIKLETFIDPDLVEESDAAQKRIQKLPWHFYELSTDDRILPQGKRDRENAWVNLDERVSSLRNAGKLEPWSPGDKAGFIPTLSPCMAVGSNSTLIPTAFLQLLLKLPRIQIYPRFHSYPKFLFFRFNGGTGICAGLDPEKHSPSFALWKPDLSRSFTSPLFTDP